MLFDKTLDWILGHNFTWGSFQFTSYTFLVRLFLDFSAQNLECCPESLWTIITLHCIQRTFPSIILFDCHSDSTKWGGLMSFIISQMRALKTIKVMCFSGTHTDNNDRVVIRTHNLWVFDSFSTTHVAPYMIPQVAPIDVTAQ